MKTIIIALSLVLVACSSSSNQAGNLLSSTNFESKIKTTTDAQIIDVRTPEEYIDGHIEGALNINVQDQKFAEQISKLDKTKTVYIYCRSGSRSQMAASQMKTLGFKSIIDLKGGYMNY
jgi:rhodanese-related sulfurtransferase